MVPNTIKPKMPDYRMTIPPRKKTELQPTKKTDCQATMSVVVIDIFPKFKVDNIKNIPRIRKEKLKQLKTSMQHEDELVESETLYLVTVSKPSVHSHPVWTTFLTQTLHPQLKTMIYKYVNKGITNVRTIKVLLRAHVKNHISSSIASVAQGFYPSNRTIYNNVLKNIYKTKQSKFDQDALVAKIEEWIARGDAKCFYQGYSRERKEEFMFCYQTEWQQDLLMRYGDILLLDATYKTTKYSLPLFSLVVKTNSRYIIVGFS